MTSDFLLTIVESILIYCVLVNVSCPFYRCSLKLSEVFDRMSQLEGSMKLRLIWIMAMLLILGSLSPTHAHSVLSRETKPAGDYQIVMEATAHVPNQYE